MLNKVWKRLLLSLLVAGMIQEGLRVSGLKSDAFFLFFILVFILVTVGYYLYRIIVLNQKVKEYESKKDEVLDNDLNQ